MFSSNDRCIVLPSRRPDSYLGEEDMTKTARDVAKDDKLVELLVLAEQQGWEVKPTNNGKLIWYPKDKDCLPVTSPTRLVGRSLANVRTALERAGLDTSSLRNDRPKKRAAVLVTHTEATDVADLPEQEQRHAQLQEILSDTLAGIVQEMPDYRQGNTDLINSSIDLFLVESGRALMNFMQDTTKAFSCNHVELDDIKARLEEAERLYIETCSELEQIRKHAEKQEAKVSELGSQYAKACQEAADNLERANRAENRLRALRTALTED